MSAGCGTRLSVAIFIALYRAGGVAHRAAAQLLSALAPPLMAGLLVKADAGAVLGLAILLSAVVLAIMVVRSRRRPSRGTFRGRAGACRPAGMTAMVSACRHCP